MHSVAQAALIGGIVASALGALLLCFVAIRDGVFSSTPPAVAADPTRQWLPSRLGYIAAILCFGITACLLTIGHSAKTRSVMTAVVPVAPTRESPPAVTREDVTKVAAAQAALETADGATAHEVSAPAEEARAATNRVSAAARDVESLDHRVAELESTIERMGRGRDEIMSKITELERETKAALAARESRRVSTAGASTRRPRRPNDAGERAAHPTPDQEPSASPSSSTAPPPAPARASEPVATPPPIINRPVPRQSDEPVKPRQPQVQTSQPPSEGAAAPASGSKVDEFPKNVEKNTTGWSSEVGRALGKFALTVRQLFN